MSSHYKYGRRKELQVAEHFERRGFDWERARGSRGPVDLLVKAKAGRLRPLAIQVKATRALSISINRLTEVEKINLIIAADYYKAVPILALVSRNYVSFLSIPDMIVIAKGRLKTLKYTYFDEP